MASASLSLELSSHGPRCGVLCLLVSRSAFGCWQWARALETSEGRIERWILGGLLASAQASKHEIPPGRMPPTAAGSSDSL
jgi:hypothetical protein